MVYISIASVSPSCASVRFCESFLFFFLSYSISFFHLSFSFSLTTASRGANDVRAQWSEGPAAVTGIRSVATSTDQLPLDAMHAQKRWSPLVAVVPDLALARKHITSRKSRYSGLLGVVQLEQSDDPQALPVSPRMAAWLAMVDSLAQAKSCLETAKCRAVGRLCMAYQVQQGESPEAAKELWELSQLVKDSGIAATVIAAKSVESREEGEPYDIRLFQSAADASSWVPEMLSHPLSCADVVRVAVESLCMQDTVGSVYCMGRGDDQAAQRLRALRRRGLSRPEELRERLKASQQHEALKTARSDATGTTVATGAQQVGVDEVVKGGKATGQHGGMEGRLNDATGKDEDEIRDLFERAAKRRVEKEQQRLHGHARAMLSREWHDKFAYRYVVDATKEKVLLRLLIIPS
eukprot:GHVS01039836.1.p1 GENE.GHVS01039836.1~~GHVS01039836.1.p1  ORF type:complete len:408 (+),score=87.88 GHVS01039836.1:70-1293(+)